MCDATPQTVDLAWRACHIDPDNDINEVCPHCDAPPQANCHGEPLTERQERSLRRRLGLEAK